MEEIRTVKCENTFHNLFVLERNGENMINDNRIFMKNYNILYEKIEGSGMLLYDDFAKETHLLNETASKVFVILDGVKKLNEVFDEYMKNVNTSEVDNEQVVDDFMELIDLMIDKRIVVSNE